MICNECENTLIETDIDDGGDIIVVMRRAYTTDEERSRGPKRATKLVCWRCAWELFETGEWESDDPRDFSTEPEETPDGIRHHMEPPPNLHFVASKGEYYAIGRSSHEAILTVRALDMGIVDYHYPDYPVQARENLRKGYFAIDGDPKLVVEGYTCGKVWNGWADIMFTKDQAREWVKTNPNDALLSGVDGCLVIFNEGETTDTIYPIQVEIDGVSTEVYDMNSYCFVEMSKLEDGSFESIW